MFTLCVAAPPTAPSYSAKDILEAFAKGQRAGQKGRSDAAFDFEGEARRAHVRAHPEDRTLEEQLARVKEELHQVTSAAAGLQRENAELRLQVGIYKHHILNNSNTQSRRGPCEPTQAGRTRHGS